MNYQDKKKINDTYTKYFFILLLVLCSSYSQAQSESNFVNLKLSKEISLDIPKSWSYMKDAKNNLIETYAESLTDLTGVPAGKTNLLLEAGAPGVIGFMSISVTVEKRLVPASQSQLKQVTKQQLVGLDIQNRSDIEAGSKYNGLKIISWNGTTIEETNAKYAIVKRYKYTLPGSPVIDMEIHTFPLGEYMVSVMVQNTDDTALYSKAIFERIRSSLSLGF
jgi:effector-binding domain-containing protein